MCNFHSYLLYHRLNLLSQTLKEASKALKVGIHEQIVKFLVLCPSLCIFRCRSRSCRVAGHLVPVLLCSISLCAFLCIFSIHFVLFLLLTLLYLYIFSVLSFKGNSNQLRLLKKCFSDSCLLFHMIILLNFHCLWRSFSDQLIYFFCSIYLYKCLYSLWILPQCTF